MAKDCAARTAGAVAATPGVVSSAVGLHPHNVSGNVLLLVIHCEQMAGSVTEELTVLLTGVAV